MNSARALKPKLKHFIFSTLRPPHPLGATARDGQHCRPVDISATRRVGASSAHYLRLRGPPAVAKPPRHQALEPDPGIQFHGDYGCFWR